MGGFFNALDQYDPTRQNRLKRFATPPFLPRGTATADAPPPLPSAAPAETEPPSLPPPSMSAPPERPPAMPTAAPPTLPQMPEPQGTPSLKRKILSGIVGGLAGYVNSNPNNRPVDVSGLQTEIAHPGYREQLRKYGLQTERAKEQADIESKMATAAYHRSQAQASTAKQKTFKDLYDEARAAGASDAEAKVYASGGHITQADPPKLPTREEEYLVRQLDDPNPEVRKRAQARLDVINGKTQRGPSIEEIKLNPKNYTPEQLAEANKMWADSHRPPASQSDLGKEAIETAAQSLAKGDLTPIRDIASMRGEQRLIIFHRARQINPSFDTRTIDRKVKMEDNFTNGKDGQNLQSFGIFLQHGGEASRTVNAVRATGSPVINRPLNWWKRNMSGSPEYQAFMTSLEPVRKEFEGFLLGGRALYGDDRANAEKILSDNSSPAQIQAALKQMGKTAKDRYTEMNHRYRRVMGKDIENPFSPDALEGARAIGVDLGNVPQGQTRGTPESKPAESRPIVQHSKSTGQYRYSTDGGKTWNPGQPPGDSGGATQNPNPPAVQQPSTQSPEVGRIRQRITERAPEFGVDPALATAVAHAESDFDPKAIGTKGDGGLFQLMPKTAQWLGVRDVYNPEQNIEGGLKFLKYLNDKYKGDRAKVLMAYNGGEGNVDRGTVSTAAKEYAARILAQLGQNE